jgi:integrase/recombinase XerD
MNANDLEGQLETYLALRLTLGRRDARLRDLLQKFIRYVVARHHEGTVPARTAVDWACATSKQAGDSRRAYRLSAARGFLVYVRASFPETEVPEKGLLRKSPRRVPYLFSREQILLLLKAASNLGPAGSLRPHAIETMLGLMASTGIRVGEAIDLKIGDVKLDTDPPVLEIRDTKFHKSRLVPLHPTTAEKLRCYAAQRLQINSGRNPATFFVSGIRSRLCYWSLRYWFDRTTRDLGMHAAQDRRKPSLHGLRHHFAVERLTLWCQQGASVKDLAPTLSVYLGHVSPADSYWYLSSTPALLMTAGGAFQRYATSGGAS